MLKSVFAAATAAVLFGAPLAQAVGPESHGPEAERAYLDEFHQAVGIVPINTWNDHLSIELGNTICQAANDGISLDHYRASAWQGRAVDPALRHLCPNLAAAKGMLPAPVGPPRTAEQN